MKYTNKYYALQLNELQLTDSNWYNTQLIPNFVLGHDRDIGAELVETILRAVPKTYVVTDKVAQNELPKIKDPQRVIKLLGNIPNDSGMFVMNKYEWFKYVKIGDKVHFMYCVVDVNDGHRVAYTTFTLNITENSATLPQEKSNIDLLVKDVQRTLDNFLRIMIYTFYSKNDFIILQPQSRIGKTKKGNKIINETSTRITIIDSFWNKTIMRLEGFDVSGFFRLQPCGPGNMDRTLIWINPFRKNGYVRHAKSDSINISLN